MREDTIECWIRVFNSIQIGDKQGFKDDIEQLNIKGLRDICELTPHL